MTTSTEHSTGVAPVPGVSTAGEIDAYLQAIQDRVDEARAKYDQAGTDAERDKYGDLVRGERRFLRDERDRLTPRRSMGLATGGKALVGIGGAGFLVGVLVLGMGVVDGGFAHSLGGESSQGHDLMIAAGACMGISLAPIAAGIPMIAVGLRRTPMSTNEANAASRFEREERVTLTWRY